MKNFRSIGVNISSVDGIVLQIDYNYWFGVDRPPSYQENSTSITIRKNETITVGSRPPPPPSDRRYGVT
jgi:hypothetical protein